MQILNLFQHIVFKRVFITLLLCVCIFSTSPADAKDIGKDVVDLIKKGDTAKAVTLIIQETDFLPKDATQIIQGIQKGQINPETAIKLVNQLTNGQIPVEVGKVLSAIQKLGDLGNIKNISDIFKNPQITKALGDAFKQAGIPTEVTNIIGNIGNIAINPESLPDKIKEQVIAVATKAIADALKKSAPELSKVLENLLGGSNGVLDAISIKIGEGATIQLSFSGGISSGGGPSCGAECNSCSSCAPKINENHRRIRSHVTSEFEQHRNWLVTTYFLENILPAMMLMSNQITTTMMQQVQIVGTFFDAKHQLETQRLFQQLTAKAHKDYHPSESLCVIGTNVRSLAASERNSNLSQMVLADRMLQRQLSTGQGISTQGGKSDRSSRVHLFINKFCNKTDHGRALQLLCKDGGKSPNQINMDVNYTAALENKLTLELNFIDKDSNGKAISVNASEDEENIFALGANLFGNKIIPIIPKEFLANTQHQPYDAANLYIDLRAIAAKRSVAQNSFAAITALKTQGGEEVAPFLKAILFEAGINPTEIEDRLGEYPSYFAQMEVMTKDIYQNPTFYTELYDKPVNIERKGAALQAIELMQDRDMYKSLLRSEAVLATLIETMLSKEHARISRDLGDIHLKGETFISAGGP